MDDRLRWKEKFLRGDSHVTMIKASDFYELSFLWRRLIISYMRHWIFLGCKCSLEAQK